MIIENSPNVKMVYNTELKHIVEYLDSKEYSLKSKHHGDGIYEISIKPNSNTIRPKIEKSIENTFNEYKNEKLVYKVNRSGIDNFDDCNEVGSVRFCTNYSNLAKSLTNIILESDIFPSYYEKYQFLNVSPYFRFMKYTNGGMHYPHYDSDYQFINLPSYTTRYSLVMYFTDNGSGELAFNKDSYEDKTDWDRHAFEDEIFLKIQPQFLKIVLFPHSICHSVLEVKYTRIAMRGDLIYGN